MRLQSHHNPGSRPRGFTLAEILFALLIIAILAALLIVGMRAAGVFARATTDRQAVNAVKLGVEKFKQDFGFVPPLVRDQAAGADTPASVVTIALPGPPPQNVNAIAVYPEGAAIFATPTAGPQGDNIFRDNRYSERSLPYFLVGGLEVGVSGNPGQSAQADVPPIDGVKGPGFYKPRADGTFELPRHLFDTSAPKRGNPFEPLVNLGGSGPKLVTSAEPNQAAVIVLADRKNAALRFYRWQHTGAAANYADMNIPPLVGRDPGTLPGGVITPSERDVTRNPALRDARWAIVAAGATASSAMKSPSTSSPRL